jgi:6-phosphofructokinase 1
MAKAQKINVDTLGECTVESPLELSTSFDDNIPNFFTDDHPVRFFVPLPSGQQSDEELDFEQAGPRQNIFFDPAKTKAAIVTCGGLCPGLNNVIRSITMELTFGYGVKDIYGIKFGYRGMNPKYGLDPIRLTSSFVDAIHQQGGTILGSSRGQQPTEVIVDYLVKNEINILFVVGGDGTLRGGRDIADEIGKRGLKIAVVGVPKTIDNDINFCMPSFGFSTAVGIANDVVRLAHVEAKGTYRGVGLVKLMGRSCGFIAVGATITSQMVNFCLIPEMPFALNGENGLLKCLERRLETKDHAVIVVAEGAGQELFEGDTGCKDASGNVRFQDIGLYLKESISQHFKDLGDPIDVKYIDPSYMVRGTEANGQDSYLCDGMARSAVHAAMSGRTKIFIGSFNNTFAHVPIEMGAVEKQQVNPEGRAWSAVLATTGQPPIMR